jgi:ubiquinone/menaquinone biosynthesis C-methylase UbiE
VGVDFAGAMLVRGLQKIRALGSSPVALVRGDATRLPLAGGTMDAAMIAFGIHASTAPSAPAVRSRAC